MAKVTTSITNKQGEVKKSAAKKYVLLSNDGNPVATLIDKDLAEKWVAERKMGAVKYVEGAFNTKTSGAS
jgi:uncharacterized protein YlbG (UPF0298 family)